MDITEHLRQAALGREASRCRTAASYTISELGELVSRWQPAEGRDLNMAAIESELATLIVQVGALRDLCKRVQNGSWVPKTTDL